MSQPIAYKFTAKEKADLLSAYFNARETLAMMDHDEDTCHKMALCFAAFGQDSAERKMLLRLLEA